MEEAGEDQDIDAAITSVGLLREAMYLFGLHVEAPSVRRADELADAGVDFIRSSAVDVAERVKVVAHTFSCIEDQQTPVTTI